MLAVCWFLGLAGQESHAQLFSVTPHDLLPEEKIVVEDAHVPQWKALWDNAREKALQGNFDAALEEYRTLLGLKSNLKEARWELARLLMYLKRWDEADEPLELLIESEPGNIQYINALGKVMWEMGQYERAVALFKKAYEKDPSDVTTLAGLVEGLTKLNKKTEALPYLEQLTLREPMNRGVRRYLALLLYETGNYEKARAHFTILSRNENVEFDVLLKTAKTYELLGRDKEASSYWERVVAREPDNMEAHVFLAQYYEKVGQLDRSLTHLQAIAAQGPGNFASYVRLGEFYEKTGDYKKAIDEYKSGAVDSAKEIQKGN